MKMGRLAMEGTLVLLVLCAWSAQGQGQVLTPPYFNLAEGRRITSSSTCGVGVTEPELYCKLVGAHADQKDNPNVNLIQGQVCDYCDPNNQELAHPPENAIDGTERWWQSPPLSRGNAFNSVNLTIDLGQEFHVAYVFIKMANSPRPGIWALERSTNHGETWEPWQYFADTPSDCVNYFGVEFLEPIIRDDSVICETKFSKVVPLEGGEVVVSFLNDRPSANNFYNSTVLQEWTKATNIRLRLIRTKTLLGHLMSVARQDPTVTRRYFYSIRDISIGGRCVCNGHADNCDITDPQDPYKLLCRCQHNTCGAQCEKCCHGFVQKKWRAATYFKDNECEACNCFGHADECVYDEETDKLGLSLDISGNFEGGGVCQQCRHNTEGINCNRCQPGYYRPYGKPLNATDVCHPCQCNFFYSTGSCAEGSGQCECRNEFLPPLCDQCNVGYFGYPDCRPCDCHQAGTRDNVCEIGGGQCPCKTNYAGKNCDQCGEGYFNFPDCLACDCNVQGSISHKCDAESGQCTCSNNYGGRTCSECDAGFYDYPDCKFCDCDRSGCNNDVCDKAHGRCLCKEGFGGSRCDQCAPGYFGYPHCKPCDCHLDGSVGTTCDETGRCQCMNNFAGLTCKQCSPGYYRYPQCLPCNCDTAGSIGISCDGDGRCQCRPNFDGVTCNACKKGFYNYPACEECNCHPAGVLQTFGGCGTLTTGELCQCKERVSGRVCNQCRPLYWNLQPYNPLGCEECDCHIPGTMGGINVCDGASGQCFCKPNTASRRCNECQDGTFHLEEDNMFGCRDCSCDVGGSLSPICDKTEGQCACRPRVSGKTCSEPLKVHYFPTLLHMLYEIEDGHTPAHTPVRFGYSDTDFPDYSWRGYGIFSPLQKEVRLEVFVEKPSLYRVVIRYVNKGSEHAIGHITFIPHASADIQQTSPIYFETTRNPKLITVSGTDNISPFHFVLNPGRWTTSIKVDKPLLVDYFALIPAAYYEAALLHENVNLPCKLGDEFGACRHYMYPEMNDFATVRGEAGTIAVGDARVPTQVYSNEELLDQLGNGGDMALLNEDQRHLSLELFLPKPGRYMLVLSYYTPEGGKTSTLDIETSSTSGRDKGRTILYDCMFTTVCRQAVTDPSGRVIAFNFDTNYVTLHLKGPDDVNVAIDSVMAIPSRQWHTDYIGPKPACLRQDGKCVDSLFHVIPGTVKLEVETDNEDQKTDILPTHIYDDTIGLIYLDHKDAMLDVRGQVPHSGNYVFVVHYYQPRHPEFDLDVLIQNGQFYEALLPAPFCPSISGCRSIVRSKDGETKFQILENFVFTLKEPNHKSVWVDYILAIPADSYKPEVLQEMPLDRAVDFITLCGKDHFYMDPQTSGFCRDATFSLTSEYNNGGLPCQCNFEGSLDFQCDAFGGQCKCRPNVIGRTCSDCRTGYYGFPDCRACSCPSTALCHPRTGECICPPRVTGENCDSCVANTYGFDPIIGCEDCDCNPLGVNKGQLQCDELTGRCDCKLNIVGRTCDMCQPGYWAFPACQLCKCDLRGTTDDICEQDSSRCYCKENVYGSTCDQCKPGTYHLEERNTRGCTKCFCFGRTDRCTTSAMFRTQILEVDGWTLQLFQPGSVTSEESVDIEPDVATMNVVLPEGRARNSIGYFSAPFEYLGNRLTSYGGMLRYTVTCNDGGIGPFVDSPPLIVPDVILVGSNFTVAYEHVEQPASGEPLEVEVDLLEDNFVLLSGGPVTREQLMMVLYSLEAVYIRAAYFTDAVEASLSQVMLDTALSSYLADAPQALSVEQCQCPANYQGTSCEDCAPGFYRTQAGPYGGYCVPCKCHGHADTCDSLTGICLNCKHNTTGEHCDTCLEGYHGDAKIGTPYDCLICACPLPTISNNFAVSCEFSPSGLEIRCDCKPGYYGPRCNYCASGFYGRPEFPGETCQPCQCSGNIDATSFGSCDSLTGECLQCLNNTFGAACELCAPGFYGDAVSNRNCKTHLMSEKNTEVSKFSTFISKVAMTFQSTIPLVAIFTASNSLQSRGFHPSSTSVLSSILLSSVLQSSSVTASFRQDAHHQHLPTRRPPRTRDQRGGRGRTRPPRILRPSTRRPRYFPPGCSCDVCGTRDCHHSSGTCQCQPNVIGDKCEECAPGYWGFESCEGCISCDCGNGADSNQCDIHSGQCRCKPGITGRTCDHCLPGYWNYGAYGCEACRCNEDYSIGGSCNPKTGQCECLPGVVGERCDRCPFRWALIENVGCHECGTCVHVLLDDVDAMRRSLEPVRRELEGVSLTYFAYQRLYHINGTVNDLRPIVDLLTNDPSSLGSDLRSFERQVADVERESKQQDKHAAGTIMTGEETSADADGVRIEALALEKMIRDIAHEAAGIVDNIRSLSHQIVAGSGPDVDRKIEEAERLLGEIKRRDFVYPKEKTQDEDGAANDTLARAKQFALPVKQHQNDVEALKERLGDIDAKLRELMNTSFQVMDKASKAKGLYDTNKLAQLQNRIAQAEATINDIKKLLDDGTELNRKARELLDEAKDNIGGLFGLEDERLREATERLRAKVDDLTGQVESVTPVVEKAEKHAEHLMDQAAKLDGLLADTRQTSENAVKAANAHANIVEAINEALRAAEAAVEAANQAKNMSDGMDTTADNSKERSEDLLRQAHEALARVRPPLVDRMEHARQGVQQVGDTNKRNREALDELNRGMARLPIHGLGPVARNAVNISSAANEKAQKALNTIQGIGSRLPEDLKRAEQVPRDIDEANKAVKASYGQVEKARAMVPDIVRIMNRLGSKDKTIRVLGVDVGEKIAELKRKIALARDNANRIKLGVHFTPDVALQLQNPDGLSNAATYSKLSLYFKTDKKDGFLVYLGNEIKAHERMRRAITDDYMSVGIESGRVVLTMDMGSGFRSIFNLRDVSDNQWHQVIVERIGKSATLTVRTEDEVDEVVDGTLPGTHAVFNLDQEVSKLYVGGIPEDANVQKEIRYRRFEGDIEELAFDNSPIGLWNFAYGENNFEGFSERDKLVVQKPSTGLRFDGSGYTILSKRSSDKFDKRVEVILHFRTYAQDGLLFLIGKDPDFFAVELRDGRVLFQFELGSGVATLTSSSTVRYNDGSWHIVQASRSGKLAILWVDSVEVANATSPGKLEDLSVTNKIFVGGYPGNHSFRGVTNKDFEGCIDNMQIGTGLIDLNNNKEALGVVSGCPSKVARSVSFTEDDQGFIAMPGTNMRIYAQFTFKFKTLDPSSLFFYTTNEDQSNYLSVSLDNGAVVFRSKPGGEVRTGATTSYNDKEWHYVTATREDFELRLDIDDYEVFQELGSRGQVVTTSPIYIGGVPSFYNIVPEGAASTLSLIGCIGDVTVNGVFQNFANTTDRSGGSFASCPIADPTPSPPTLVTVMPPVTPAPDEFIHEVQVTEPVTQRPKGRRSTTPRPKRLTTPLPTPVGRCALSLHPRGDPDLSAFSGYRFGLSGNSFQEYNIIPSHYKYNLRISLEFKTDSGDGVLFYLTDAKFLDFISLYLSKGKVYFSFNVGSGIASFFGPNNYDDGKWHSVVAWRKSKQARLTIDDEDVVDDRAEGNLETIDAVSPLYVGGISSTISEKVKDHIKVWDKSYNGCIRNLKLFDQTPEMPRLDSNTQPCSDKVEAGSFFSADGGYIVLYDRFSVGTDMITLMDIKPRDTSGVIMAVHGGKGDFLALQLINGTVVFSVDNGAGIFETTFYPPDNYWLCDGKWHRIHAVKAKNILMLSVDTMFAEPGIGPSGVSSTDTQDLLYFGGLPDPSRTKGIKTTAQYVGCIRNVELKEQPEKLSTGRPVGNVHLGACPTI